MALLPLEYKAMSYLMTKKTFSNIGLYNFATKRTLAGLFFANAVLDHNKGYSAFYFPMLILSYIFFKNIHVSGWRLYANFGKKDFVFLSIFLLVNLLAPVKLEHFRNKSEFKDELKHLRADDTYFQKSLRYYG